jgi:ATP-binding cassette subfamily B protein
VTDHDYMHDAIDPEAALADGSGSTVGEADFADLISEEPTRGALRRDWRLLPRALQYMRPYRRYAVPSVIATVLVSLVALAQPWPLAFVIDSVVGEKPAPGWVTSMFGSEIGALIAVAVAATLLLTLLSGGLTVINEYLTTTIDQYMSLDFRSDLFQHVQRLSLAYHDTQPLGVLMFKLNSQASAVGGIIVGLPAIAQSILTIGGMAFITFRIDPLLAVLALGVTPFIFYSTTYYTDRIEPRLYRVRGMEGMNMAIVHEAMAMLRVVLAFGRERREFRRFRTQGEQTVKARVELTVRQTAFQLAVQLITSAGTAAVLGVGAYQAVHGRISAGELLVVLSYIAQVYQPLEQLTQTATGYQQQFISFRQATDLLDLAPQIAQRPDARKIKRAKGEIEFDHVAFTYPEPELTPRARRRLEAQKAQAPAKPREPIYALRDLSFKIAPGEAVAVVGPTGAGKSTLASLLPRFYDPVDGRVLIDGVDVRDMNVDSLRAQFSIVLQEPLLFSGTIFQNICYGKPNATAEEVEEAARAANAHDFITQLPGGYDTLLGERGTKISGGERQRIAVARAFLRDAPILILDEPTSAIDSRTESVILDALDRLMEGRTTLLIAHRLSTLRNVDNILVLNEGRIVQRGRHDALVAEDGLYRELWQAQAGALADRAPDASSAGDAARRSSEPSPVSPSASTEENGSGPLSRSRNGGQPQRPASTRRLALDRPRVPPDSSSRPKIVLLGMLTTIPVGGVAWLVGQYATGFRRLGFDVYYVEAHARTPSIFMKDKDDDGTSKAVRYLARTAKRFGLDDRWAFQALHENGRCYGMTAEQLDRLYRDAALVINMHGGTLPLPEHVATDRLVYLGTDPVQIELEVARGNRSTIELLDHHVAFFTWGLNYGNPDCALPWAESYPFVPTRPPVVLDFWDNDAEPSGPLTTIGNWRQRYRDLRHDGHLFTWSKHQQFLKVIDLPRRVHMPIELALSSYEDRDHLLLAEHGWRVRPGLTMSSDLDSYRDYIVDSAGEFSVAKEQNVHFRSGWFSERSATYLAAGRPVVLQDTGFGAALPTGSGLFAFSDVEEAAEAIDAVQSDPVRHRRAAREIAKEYLSHDVVLGAMLDHVGLHRRKGSRPAPSFPPVELPADLSLEVLSRRPLELAEPTVAYALNRPVPSVAAPVVRPVASVVVPVLDNLPCTRLALESVLANTLDLPYELVIVDNGSANPTREYLEVLAARNVHVRLIRNDANRGFAPACNQGLHAAAGEHLVLLNNDTIVPPGWLGGLSERLDDPGIGVVTPMTNRCGGAAQVASAYETYEEMVSFARERAEGARGKAAVDIDVAEMFCAATRRDVFEAVGPLDERFELGMFEDDDYARRVREAGYRVACAEDVFVHHFGEASLGALAADGRYGDLFHANRRRFEEKWQVTWWPHDRREEPEYEALKDRLRAAIREHVPEGATVLVASRGDDALLGLDGHDAWHFPRLDDGTFAGSYPEDDQQAIAQLERLREEGAEYFVLPATSLWWLERYDGFRRHLERYPRSSEATETGVIYELGKRLDGTVREKSTV